MGSELKRSMDSLRMGGGPPPYFLSYLLWDVESYRMQASLGACELAAQEDQRLVEVDLRVGSYRHDNTNFQGGIVFGPRLRLPMPQENDTALIKLALWAATDAKYKVALEQLAQKRAFLENQAGKDTLPDFTRQKVLVQRQAEPRTPPDTAKVVRAGQGTQRLPVQVSLAAGEPGRLPILLHHPVLRGFGRLALHPDRQGAYPAGLPVHPGQGRRPALGLPAGRHPRSPGGGREVRAGLAPGPQGRGRLPRRKAGPAAQVRPVAGLPRTGAVRRPGRRRAPEQGPAGAAKPPARTARARLRAQFPGQHGGAQDVPDRHHRDRQPLGQDLERA